MARQMPPTRGRPKGSGNTAGKLDLQLTHAEAVPFRAGYRICMTNPTIGIRWTGDLSVVSPLLMPHERAELVEQGDDKFRALVGIGMAAAMLVQSLAFARAA